MIKVLIVDDEPLARGGLRVFLQEQSDIGNRWRVFKRRRRDRRGA